MITAHIQQLSSERIDVPNILLAHSIKQIDSKNINIGIRYISNNALEYWIICNEMDYEILDKVYDVYQSYANKIVYPVEFVFTSKEQFFGKECIHFLKKI